MNISKIKKKLQNYKGELVKFKFNGARNQVEEFQGIIENTYNYVFTIKLNDEHQIRKSFSYSDILIESLEMFIDWLVFVNI